VPRRLPQRYRAQQRARDIADVDGVHMLSLRCRRGRMRACDEQASSHFRTGKLGRNFACVRPRAVSATLFSFAGAVEGHSLDRRHIDRRRSPIAPPFAKRLISGTPNSQSSAARFDWVRWRISLK
jgi:hypothetical protein